MRSKLLHIALVDDDEDDRFVFREAIGEIDIHTKLSLFDNGQELMDFLALPNIILPELIFLDLNMPIKNGITCLREIRSNPRFKNVIIAIYSTSSSEKDIEQTFIHGANIYINKPNDFDDLRNALQKVLTLNWQYANSNLNKQNFLLKL
ncbi:response regulator [Robertkochia solimangrovi]|uniref:response regulator n=1 Tax=Robertkochia solimangrovi TaxID=2213046 RepID=UPI00117DF5C9|nr:response regulator [Robertkochia solimangrovi]TRZ42930.1 response regulator [Robertkochia solimangrovi]